MASHREYRWWLPSNLDCGECCESVCACGSSVHQKCYNYALINVLFGLYMPVWTSLSFVLIPISEFQHALFILEVVRTKGRIPTPSPFVVFTFGFAFESYEEFGGASNDRNDLDPNTIFLMFTLIQLKNMRIFMKVSFLKGTFVNVAIYWPNSRQNFKKISACVMSQKTTKKSFYHSHKWQFGNIPYNWKGSWWSIHNLILSILNDLQQNYRLLIPMP